VSQVRIKKRGPIIMVERRGAGFAFVDETQPHVRAAIEYLETHLVEGTVVHLDAIHQETCAYDDRGICTCTPTILEHQAGRGVNISKAMRNVPASILEHIQASKAKTKAKTAIKESRSLRRTPAEMAILHRAIHDVLEEIQPATDRQAFYALTVRSIIEKTEKAYKGTVVRQPVAHAPRRRDSLRLDHR
jgi:hypothetical protein